MSPIFVAFPSEQFRFDYKKSVIGLQADNMIPEGDTGGDCKRSLWMLLSSTVEEIGVETL